MEKILGKLQESGSRKTPNSIEPIAHDMLGGYLEELARYMWCENILNFIS
jgi:hypothetical protein